MAEKTDLQTLLVFEGPTFQSQPVLDFLREHFDVQVARDLEEADGAIRRGEINAVLAETGDFLPLERNLVRRRASVVLDAIGDGVGVGTAEGNLLWQNRRMRQFTAAAIERVRQVCRQACLEFAAAPQKHPERGRRYSFTLEDGTYFEVICSSLPDKEGSVRQVAAFVIDATNQRRQQQKLDAIQRAGKELVGLQAGQVAHQRASERVEWLKQRIRSYCKEVVEYQHFAVLVLDRQNNRLELLVDEGMDEDADAYNLLASTEDNGICGYVAATGRSYLCPDVRNDVHYLPGLRHARSSLTVPLRLENQVVGVLNVESTRPNMYHEEDRQFAEILGNYVAVALHTLKLLADERWSVHRQLRDSIGSKLLEPLEEIINIGTETAEDYVGDDDLRRRMNALVDRATQARRFLRHLSDGTRRGIIPDTAAERKADPAFSGKRVLVADDEQFIRRSISEILAPQNCTVDLAEDGQEACEMIRKHPYDLVISDIKMPGANGYEVFAACRSACPDAQVILITGFGYDPDHSIVRANREGLAAVLMKPFKAGQLLEQCRKALSPDSG